MTHHVSFLSKGEMLDAIKSYLNMNKNTEFAKFLGISSQAVSNWYARNTLDAELIYTKCGFVNADWLLTGQGEMLRHDSKKNPSLISELSKMENEDKNAQVNAQANAQVNNKTEGKPISKITSFIVSDNKPSFLNLPEVDAVPFYDLPVSAGALGVLNGWENCEPNGYVKLDVFRGCEGVFPVMGVSMEPIVHSGDLIGIKSIQGISTRWDFLQTGVIYLIITHEDRMIKYIEEAGDNDYIVCSSPNYKSFRVHKADILQLYRVKAIVRGL